MKKVALSLSVGCALLGSTSLFAQSRINLPDLNRRIVRLPVKQQSIALKHQEVAAQEKEFKENLSRAMKYLEKNPEIVGDYIKPTKFKQLKGYFKKGEFKRLKKLDKPIYRVLPGGRLEDKIAFQSDINGLLELGMTLKKGQSDKNIKAVYKKAFQLIHPEKRPVFKSPKLVGRMKTKQAKLHLSKLLKVIGHYQFIPFEPTSPGWKWNCDDEIGQQRVGTGDGANRCKTADFHPDSLFTSSSTSDFPLKYYHTCIKNQASRGTCVSLDSTAALIAKLTQVPRLAWFLIQVW